MQQQRLPFDGVDSQPKSKIEPAPARKQAPLATPVPSSTPTTKQKSPSRTASFNSSRTRRIRAVDAQTPSLFPDLDATTPVNKPDKTASHRSPRAVQQRLPFDASEAPVDETPLFTDSVVPEETAAIEEPMTDATPTTPKLNLPAPEVDEDLEDAVDPFTMSDAPLEAGPMPALDTLPPPRFKLSAAPAEEAAPAAAEAAAPTLKLSAAPAEEAAPAAAEAEAPALKLSAAPVEEAAPAASEAEAPALKLSAAPVEEAAPAAAEAASPSLKLSAAPAEEAAPAAAEAAAPALKLSAAPVEEAAPVAAEAAAPTLKLSAAPAEEAAPVAAEAEAPTLKLSAAPAEEAAPAAAEAEAPALKLSAAPAEEAAPVAAEAEAPALKLSAPKPELDQPTLKLSAEKPAKISAEPTTRDVLPVAKNMEADTDLPLAAPPRAPRPAVALAKPKSAVSRPVPKKRSPAETDDDLPSDAPTTEPEPVKKAVPSSGAIGFGERLLIARQAAGHSRQDTAQACRIRHDFVRALEEEDFHKLPRAAIHIKSYIRTLAREYELDPLDLLDACEAAMAAADLSIHPEPALRDSTKVRQAQFSNPEEDKSGSAATKPAAFVLAGIVAVIGVILIAYVVMTGGGAAPTPEMSPIDSVTEADVEMLLAPEMLPFAEVPLPAGQPEPLSPPPAPAP